MDYAKDGQWLAWNQQALRRFLVTANRPTNDMNGTLLTYAGPVVQGQLPRHVESPKWGGIPKSNQEYCTEEKPDLFGMDTLFGTNLEDSTWELATVSRAPMDPPMHLDTTTDPLQKYRRHQGNTLRL